MFCCFIVCFDSDDDFLDDESEFILPPFMAIWATQKWGSLRGICLTMIRTNNKTAHIHSTIISRVALASIHRNSQESMNCNFLISRHLFAPLSADEKNNICYYLIDLAVDDAVQTIFTKIYEASNHTVIKLFIIALQFMSIGEIDCISIYISSNIISQLSINWWKNMKSNA
jgi:hypothetical protein